MYTNHLFGETGFLNSGVGSSGVEGTVMAAAGLGEHNKKAVKELEEVFYKGFIFKEPVYTRHNKNKKCKIFIFHGNLFF